MNYLIREMVKEDTKQVQDVAKKSWNATYEGIIPNEIQENFLKSAYNDEMMEWRLRNSLMMVAEADNTITGFANFTPVNEQGHTELSAIYLLPEYQDNLGGPDEYIEIEELTDLAKIHTLTAFDYLSE